MNMVNNLGASGHANPFAGPDALHADPQTGVTRNRAGARVLTLTREFLVGLAGALEAECGPTAEAVAKSCGRAWGRRYAARLERELGQCLGTPFADVPLAEFTDCLALAFNHHGWGLLALDYGRHDRGLIVAELRHAPPVGENGLLAGLLAGLFSHFAGLTLDCIPTQRPDGEAGAARFVIGLADRLNRFADAAAQGRPHDEIMAELEAMRL
jgi:predicted hydrocarbon binding protein